MNNLCIVADSYPFGQDNSCVFVRDLIVEIAKMGIKCTVIAPQVFSIGIKAKKRPYHFYDVITDKIIIDVYSPLYISFSSRGRLIRLTSRSHKQSVMRVITKNRLSPNVIYGHFIYLCGITAIDVANEIGCKAYVVCGESTGRIIKGSKPYANGLKYCNWRRKLDSANGIISVSSDNLRILKEVGYIGNDVKTYVVPNCVNTSVFRHLDKEQMRKKLGWPKQDFTVVFVGHFIERKGPRRVDDAIYGISGIKSVFIGAGKFMPKSDCLYCGLVNHDEIAEYLNASDVFVLPTTGEGCCNAIIEAICCGLPIISAKESFNDDILDDSYSIRIDSMDIEEIRKAILELKDNVERRIKMSEAALSVAPLFSLTERANKIVEIFNN